MTMPHTNLHVSPFIARFAPLIPAHAHVLDLAAGSGRHARLLAARGARVLAVDRDPVALAASAGVPGIETRVLDLETGRWPLAGEVFDAIVVVNYLHRPLFPHLRAALAADGVILYETFAAGNQQFGRPTNPDFLLRDGELLEFACAPPLPLTVVTFEQGRDDVGDRSVVVARLAAVGPAYRGPPILPPEIPARQG
ncbi:MAG: class I SAM-dependent methyltransferase [Betaproteobacteria bacterium]